MRLPCAPARLVLLLAIARPGGGPEEEDLRHPSLIQLSPPRIDQLSEGSALLGQDAERHLGNAAKHRRHKTMFATKNAGTTGDDVKASPEQPKSRWFARWFMLVAAALIFFLFIAQRIWLYSGTGIVADYKSELTNLAAVLIWLVVGVGTVMYWEGWFFTEAMYVMVQILTTIGYGDITVSTNGMRLFMTFHVIIGVMIVSSTVNDVSNYMLKRADAATRKKMQELEMRHMSNDGDMKEVKQALEAVHQFIVSVGMFFFFVLTWALFFSLEEPCTCSYGKTAVAGCNPDDCAATGGIQLGFWNALYMGVVTMSTVGFGDFAPKTPLGRSIGSVWMFLGVLACGNMISHTAGAFGEGKKKLQARDCETNISDELFRKIDTDGSGSLSLAEYRAYVLVDRGLVSQEVMDAIDSTYNLLKGTHDEITHDAIQEFHRAH